MSITFDPETKIVAAEQALRTVGLPALDLWDKLLGRAAILDAHQDNDFDAQRLLAGYAPHKPRS